MWEEILPFAHKSSIIRMSVGVLVTLMHLDKEKCARIKLC